MKITPQDRAALMGALDETMAGLGAERLAAHYRALADDDRVNDRDKRYRWDVLWAIPKDVRYPILDRVYRYANDAHIDTVLRRAVPTPA